MAGDRERESRSVRRARRLRQNATDAERKLWFVLSRRQVEGARFRRQHPFGPYILDFYCEKARLAVEVDGGQHTAERDQARTTYLNGQGVSVLRFWNHQVLLETEAVAEMIAHELRQRATPSPSRR
ncbi:endonuclease domain-containing protein [Inquilinus limosus]|uniref:endonuclease domain-containing protein n=1 Tax=Inquilinus limosus TaxID=171674 RepID=UPI003F16ECC1